MHCRPFRHCPRVYPGVSYGFCQYRMEVRRQNQKKLSPKDSQATFPGIADRVSGITSSSSWSPPHAYHSSGVSRRPTVCHSRKLQQGLEMRWPWIFDILPSSAATRSANVSRQLDSGPDRRKDRDKLKPRKTWLLVITMHNQVEKQDSLVAWANVGGANVFEC